MATRMTKQSKENLEAAERAELVNVKGEANGGGSSWYIQLWRGGRLGIVHGGDGLVMLYPTAGAAERALLRVRPGISFTLSTMAISS
jgi:hypothetical protein